MNRRLRLAFLLAALAVAGPMPSARFVEAARAEVTVAWFQGERIVTPKIQQSVVAIPNLVVGSGFLAHPEPVLSPSRLPHSLFQRPPPRLN